ncbi:hypothetical protein FraQA3DRAFT_4458 [Frankia sp. QA3]|nr:hypothetical protein FraQA3DRAFT_4458 [Frankia sp. QA3]
MRLCRTRGLTISIRHVARVYSGTLVRGDYAEHPTGGSVDEIIAALEGISVGFFSADEAELVAVREPR